MNGRGTNNTQLKPAASAPMDRARGRPTAALSLSETSSRAAARRADLRWWHLPSRAAKPAPRRARSHRRGRRRCAIARAEAKRTPPASGAELSACRERRRPRRPHGGRHGREEPTTDDRRQTTDERSPSEQVDSTIGGIAGACRLSPVRLSPVRHGWLVRVREGWMRIRGGCFGCCIVL